MKSSTHAADHAPSGDDQQNGPPPAAHGSRILTGCHLGPYSSADRLNPPSEVLEGAPGVGELHQLLRSLRL
jgi:hypothetical protein